MRLGAACRVMTYAYCAYAILGVLARRSSGSGSGTSPRSASAELLAQPLGQVLLGVTGVVIACVGLGLIIFGMRGEFIAQLAPEASSRSRRYPIIVLGYVGYCTKGVAFVVVGVLVCWAGATDDPGQTGGLDHSLERLMGAAWGPSAVALFGAGLGCFGLYLLARARHLRRRTLTA
jgi:amino acid transporter